MSNSKTWKEQLREEHLQWVNEELNNLDFGRECNKERLLFAIGKLVLDLLEEKRDYSYDKER